MTDIKLKDLNESERSQLINEVDGDNAGCGVIYPGKYYVLAYKPIKDLKTYKCTGVLIFIEKIQKDGGYWYNPYTQVFFKQGLLCTERASFKDRLDSAVRKCIAEVKTLDKRIDDDIAKAAKEKLDRENAIRTHTDNIKSCQLKIDSTIKTIAPNSKSMIEFRHERLLSESNQEEILAKQPKKETATHDNMRFDFNLIRTGILNKKDTHPQEHERLANDAIIHNEKYRASNTFVDDYICNRTISTTESNKLPLVKVEVLSPTDDNYLTDLERQNATKNN